MFYAATAKHLKFHCGEIKDLISLEPNSTLQYFSQGVITSRKVLLSGHHADFL